MTFVLTFHQSISQIDIVGGATFKTVRIVVAEAVEKSLSARVFIDFCKQLLKGRGLTQRR